MNRSLQPLNRTTGNSNCDILCIRVVAILLKVYIIIMFRSFLSVLAVVLAIATGYDVLYHEPTFHWKPCMAATDSTTQQNNNHNSNSDNNTTIHIAVLAITSDGDQAKSRRLSRGRLSTFALLGQINIRQWKYEKQKLCLFVRRADNFNNILSSHLLWSFQSSGRASYWPSVFEPMHGASLSCARQQPVGAPWTPFTGCGSSAPLRLSSCTWSILRSARTCSVRIIAVFPEIEGPPK